MPVFTINSGKIRVSDPCYDKDDYLGGVVLDAKNGEWVASIDMDDVGSGWGERITKLTAEYNGPVKIVGNHCASIGVDSGQAGVFDFDSYKDNNLVKGVTRVHEETICEDEPWYSICCDRTLSKHQWGVIPNGVVSTSGYGDGWYNVDCFLDKNGDVVRVEIIFIGDEDKCEDEDEDENS